MSPAGRFVLGLLAGTLTSGLLVVGALSANLQRGLPDHPAALLAWSSESRGVVEDELGEEIASFELIGAVTDAAETPPAVVEAFLAAASPPFYESQRQSARGLMGALRRGLRQLPPDASPLSQELAGVLLSQEPDGLRRRVRAQLLATAFDAQTPVEERAAVWLEWVPLCWGERGVQKARRICLGGRAGEWGLGEAAAVAAAAVWELDLSLDRRLVLARRDAVLDLLVRQGQLSTEDVIDLPEPPPAALPPSDRVGLVSRAARPARRAARSHPQSGARVTTGVLGAEHGWLVERAELRDASWLIADVRSGRIRTLGGEIDAPRDAPGFERFVLAGQPAASRVGQPGAELMTELARPTLRRATEALAMLARGGAHRPLRLVDAVRFEPSVAVAVAAPAAPVEVLDESEAYLRLLELQPEGGLRVGRYGDLLVFAHPDVVGALALSPGRTIERLPDLLQGLYQPLPFAIPDAIALEPRGKTVVARRRDR